MKTLLHHILSGKEFGVSTGLTAAYFSLQYYIGGGVVLLW